MTETTPPSPRRRILRTAIQVLIAVPAAFAAIEVAGVDVPASGAAWAIGISGALVVLISAAQNGWEDRGA